MEADTTQFQATNGKPPRGFGRWGFQVGNEEHFIVGRYSDSRKEAFKIAQARDVDRVVVLPDKKLAPQGGHPERPEKLSAERINNIKERLMAQAEVREFKGPRTCKRTRTVIPTNGMKASQIMVVFDVQSKRTAHLIAKRGYYVVDYQKRSVCPGWIDIDSAYRIAKWWFHKRLGGRGRVPWWAEAEDMIQEGVTRLLERGGDPRMAEDSYRFYVVRSAMAEYLRRNREYGHDKGSASEDYQHCSPSPPTWQRKHSATETMCRMIEAKGAYPMERAA